MHSDLFHFLLVLIIVFIIPFLKEEVFSISTVKCSVCHAHSPLDQLA